jgi:dihydrofolate reductase
MRKLTAFNHVSLDGYFVDAGGGMGFAHRAQRDAEFDEFTAKNASGGGALLFGRVTYQMMAGFWPTAAARQREPVVAEGMNAAPKYVVSRTLPRAEWSNTVLLKGDLAAEVGKLKATPGPNLTILGSGSVVAQLARARLLDAIQLVVNPIALGGGRTMFEGLPDPLPLRLARSHTFQNGRVLLGYELTT